MLAQVTQASRVVVVRLNTGDDLLGGLRAAVEEHGIRNGLILTGVGSVSSYHYHVVGTTALPVEDLFVRGEGALDILSVTGAVIDGRVHAHVTLSGPEHALGGHLEEGCTVLTFSILVLADTPDADLAGWDTSGQL